MVKISWTGAAGLDIFSGEKTFLIDPYASRVNKFSIFFKPLVSDRRAVHGFARNCEGPIGGMVVGHTHFDHALDLVALAPFCQGPIVGSKSLDSLFQLHGVENRVQVCRGNEALRLDTDVCVSMLPACHGKVFMGRVPYPGEISIDTPLPMGAKGYGLGAVFMPEIRVKGVTILHAGSAGFDEKAVQGRTCDVLFMCVPGWQRFPGYVERLPRLVKPDLIIPFHYDDFTLALGRGSSFPTLPLINLDGFVNAVSKSAPAADVVLLKPFEELVI